MLDKVPWKLFTVSHEILTDLDIIKTLDIKALPYILFLIVPVLGRISDSDESVRLLSTSTFASLVKMVPLEVSLMSNADDRLVSQIHRGSR